MTEEIFDIVDEKGQPTGETVTRSQAHAEGVRHRTAHIWVVRDNGDKTEVLLQKRALNKDSFPGRYDTSSAGHIQAGDEPLESAIRELSEELGIQADADDLNFAGTFPIQYEKEFHGKMFRDNEIAFVYVYDEDVDIDKLTIQKEELDSVEWFDLEEVYQACQPPRDEKFCVPMGGLEIVRKYVSNQENVAKHISEMEAILDEANEILDTLDKNLNRLNDIQAKIQKLENYYTSKQWIDDFTADEQGLLPQDLKRGVLSEDGISSMLERNKDYMERIIQR